MLGWLCFSVNGLLTVVLCRGRPRVLGPTLPVLTRHFQGSCLATQWGDTAYDQGRSCDQRASEAVLAIECGDGAGTWFRRMRQGGPDVNSRNTGLSMVYQAPLGC